MTGPRIGEKWTVGSFTGLTFLGVGRDFGQDKYLVFEGGEGMFVIDKDEFYAADLHKLCVTAPQPPALTFDVVALHDRGFGPECVNLPRVEAPSVAEAQRRAEELATDYFAENFGSKHPWEEVKICPALSQSSF